MEVLCYINIRKKHYISFKSLGRALVIFKKEGNMLFENIELFPVKDMIEKIDNLYAHTRENSPHKEKLLEHLNLSINYLTKIFKDKRLGAVWGGLCECLKLYEEEEKQLFDELFLNTIYIHDIGKININYQLQRLSNELFKEGTHNETQHAMSSALIYIDYYFEKIKRSCISSRAKNLLVTYMMINGHIIARHHTPLISYASFAQNIREYIINYHPENHLFKLYKKEIHFNQDNLNRIVGNTKEVILRVFKDWESFYPYIYSKFLYSLLVASDYYATSEYIQEEAIMDLGILDNIEEWQQAYKENDTFRCIQKYKNRYSQGRSDLTQITDINDLRTELFLEAQDNLLNNLEEDIFYLEAPTGSGKTNTSIQLVLHLLEQAKLNKLFYVFPFNTLVEQTKGALDGAFKAKEKLIKDLVIINSLTPITSNQDKEKEVEEIDYNKALLDRQFFHYPAVITSHVQLFRLLFGNEKEEGMGLYQIANSVIVLDEIQSYKNTIWKEIILFLKAYAKMLHIKIIIMSATLPRLGELIEEKWVPVLIKDKEKYFSHPLFKDRVKLDFSLLQSENVYEELQEKIIYVDKLPGKKILVEFIKKKTALRFYNELMELQLNGKITKKVILITGDDNKFERQKCINKVKDKNEKDIILIATQVIEAGVDIDMDIGFKDISLLDAEEQFLGRINRSCKKEGCIVFFFNLDDAKVLYKKDYRKNKEYTLLDESMREVLTKKDFYNYYHQIFGRIKEYTSQCNDNNLESFIENGIGGFDYIGVKERMKLMDDNIYPVTVFLGITFTIEKDGEKREIDGREVWERYIALLEDKQLSYAEQKVKLSYLREEMSCFTWQVSNCNVSYTARRGELYYIENGEDYIENGKFNREKISGSTYEIL